MPQRSKLYVLAYDAHYPEHHRPSWESLFEFLGVVKVDGFLFGGDNLDCAEISHHNKQKPIYRERGAFKKNLDGFDDHILTRVESLLPKHAEKICLLGNHEDWLQQLFEEQPELEGLLSIEGYLDLERRGWEVIPQGGFKKLGHLYCVHGDAIGGGVNPAKKAAEVWAGCNVVLGHHHTLSCFTRTSPAHMSKRWTATVLPTMGTTAPTYGRNKANTHLNGFGILEIRENGDFNLYPIVTVDGIFSFGGRVYDGKRRRKVTEEIEGIELIADECPDPQEFRNHRKKPAPRKPKTSPKPGKPVRKRVSTAKR